MYRHLSPKQNIQIKIEDPKSRNIISQPQISTSFNPKCSIKFNTPANQLKTIDLIESTSFTKNDLNKIIP